MSYRHVEDCEIGDYLRRGKYRVMTIVDQTKTQWKCVSFGKENTYEKTDVIRVTKKTGTIVGYGQGYNRDYVTVLLDDETPEQLLQAGQNARDKRLANKAAADQRLVDRLEAVKDANPELKFEHIGFDLQTVTFVNKMGLQGLLIFHLTPDEIYDYEKHEEIPAFRIQSVSYSYRWHEKRYRQLGSSNDVISTSKIEGIYELISQALWD